MTDAESIEKFKAELKKILQGWRKHVAEAAVSSAANAEEAAALRAAVDNPLAELLAGVDQWIDEKPDQAYTWAVNSAVDFDYAARCYEGNEGESEDEDSA